MEKNVSAFVAGIYFFLQGKKPYIEQDYLLLVTLTLVGVARSKGRLLIFFEIRRH